MKLLPLLLSLFLVGGCLITIFLIANLEWSKKGQSSGDLFLQPQRVLNPYYEDWQLINCLIWFESRGNNGAIGLAGEQSLLQFLPQTFKEECVIKRNYQNDITNPLITKNCCSEMLSDDFDNVWHWTTAKKCLILDN